MRAPRNLSAIRLEQDNGGPLYRQICERVRNLILAGHLKPGARLPSARSLASQLSVARGTVEVAYQLLAGEGFIIGQGAAGTIVDPALDRAFLQRRLSGSLYGPSSDERSRHPREGAPPPFQMGVPALDMFPRKVWSRISARCARNVTNSSFLYQDPNGSLPLRQAIATYLGIARGINCSPKQVFITAGFLGALGLVSRLLVKPEDKVWLEDPCYPPARQAFSLAGADIVSVPVDEDGMQVATGIRCAPRASVAVVTPTNQFPLGVCLPVSRRLSLLDWARDTGAWIIEDDYDSEFQYRGRQLPSLKSLDSNGRVVYVGTFSKVLFPGLRLGYLVVPDSLVEMISQATKKLHPASNFIGETSVASFMMEGHFARHIKRMRQLYMDRRSALTDALSKTFKGKLGIDVQSGGMHLLVRFPDGIDDIALANRAIADGLRPVPLSTCIIERPIGPGLLLGFANVPVEMADAVSQRLLSAVSD